MATAANNDGTGNPVLRGPARRCDPRLIDFFFKDRESQPSYTNIDPHTGQPIDPTRPTRPPTSTWKMLRQVLFGS